MTTEQLATRLRMKQPSAVALEASENKGAIKIETLRRVANALECDLVYAFVPRKPLEEIVRDRAAAVALRMLGPVEQTMALERQSVDPSVSSREEQVQELARSLKPRHIWSDAIDGARRRK